MYLSRVEIDKMNRQIMKHLSHVGAYHNWVESSFPDEISRGVRTRKLWRIDQLSGKDYLLLVSKSKPDLRLLEAYGVEGSSQTKSYDNFLNSIEKDKAYLFRVTLNPVISRASEGDERRGRVFPILNLTEQMDFLYNRSEKNGFSLVKDEFQIVNRGFVSFRKSSKREIKLNQVTYEGRLTVTDKTKFIETLTMGFGKKKAYGFGMMTVIPEG